MRVLQYAKGYGGTEMINPYDYCGKAKEWKPCKYRVLALISAIMGITTVVLAIFPPLFTLGTSVVSSDPDSTFWWDMMRTSFVTSGLLEITGAVMVTIGIACISYCYIVNDMKSEPKEAGK